MVDKLRSSEPLDGISLLIGLKFSKSVVLHKDDVIWIDTNLRCERSNGTEPIIFVDKK